MTAEWDFMIDLGEEVPGWVTMTPGTGRKVRAGTDRIDVTVIEFMGVKQQAYSGGVNPNEGGAYATQDQLVIIKSPGPDEDWQVAVGDFIHWDGAPEKGYRISGVVPYGMHHLELTIRVQSI